MASADIVEASAMIDQEHDSSPEASSNQDSSQDKPSTSTSGTSDETTPSLGAIFQTAYTSTLPVASGTSGNSGSNSSRTASYLGPSASASLSSASITASATASGPRISNTSDLFAPELDAYFDDPTSQLFADDSDNDDDIDHGNRGVQALFVDTSSPRRSPMIAMPSETAGSTGGLSLSGSGYTPFEPGQPSRTSSRLHHDAYLNFIPTQLMTSTASL